MSIKTGIPGPWLQPSEYGRTEAGQFATVPYEDVDPNKINALAAQFDALGYRYRVTHTFGKHRLEVFLSYNPDVAQEVPVDLWEYSGMSAQKDLLSANVPSGITQKLIPANVKIIRDALNSKLPDSFTVTPTHTDLIATDFQGTADQQNAAWVLYIMMQTGYTDAIVQVPSLRHTQTVSLVYTLTLSLTNVGRIITTPKLLALESAPPWVVNGLPNDPPPNINNIILGYGWLKAGPTIQQIAHQKWQIVQEFQYGLWPVGTMGPFIDL